MAIDLSLFTFTADWTDYVVLHCNSCDIEVASWETYHDPDPDVTDLMREVEYHWSVEHGN